MISIHMYSILFYFIHLYESRNPVLLRQGVAVLMRKLQLSRRVWHLMSRRGAQTNIVFLLYLRTQQTTPFIEQPLPNNLTLNGIIRLRNFMSQYFSSPYYLCNVSDTKEIFNFKSFAVYLSILSTINISTHLPSYPFVYLSIFNLLNWP